MLTIMQSFFLTTMPILCVDAPIYSSKFVDCASENHNEKISVPRLENKTGLLSDLIGIVGLFLSMYVIIMENIVTR